MANEESSIRGCTLSPRTLLAAYLAHLLVPTVLVVDSLRVIYEGKAGNAEIVIAVVFGVWLFVAAGALALTRNRQHFLRRISAPLLTFYVTCVSLAFLELGVRIATRHAYRSPHYYQPGTKQTRSLVGLGMTGVSPTVTFSVNELGLHGPMPPKEERLYKIITVGGSTTECSALDDSQEWPHLLMQSLNDQQKNYSVWVGNAGMSGMTTVDHLFLLRRSPILSKADLLIFLIGINDLQSALLFSGAPTQAKLESRAELLLDHAPPPIITAVGGVFRRSWLLVTARKMARDLFLRFVREWDKGTPTIEPTLAAEAARRAAGPAVRLPDLYIALREYVERVRDLDRECRVRTLRCVFLTQPTVWRADLSPAEQSVLWSGRVGSNGQTFGYASVVDLMWAMDLYNRSLLDLCREDRLECFDLASRIPKDTSAFYDDMHLNIRGARMVAQILTEHLLATAPLNGGLRLPSDRSQWIRTAYE
jgi:lysophospholipase L1-like esterase